MKKFAFYLGFVGFGIYGLARMFKFAADSGANLLDLNSATERKLARLPGMMPELIEKIVENRPYLTKIDLISRRVIPDASYEQIKHAITVSKAA
jgi:competence protein ComEA